MPKSAVRRWTSLLGIVFVVLHAACSLEPPPRLALPASITHEIVCGSVCEGSIYRDADELAAFVGGPFTFVDDSPVSGAFYRGLVTDLQRDITIRVLSDSDVYVDLHGETVMSFYVFEL